MMFEHITLLSLNESKEKVGQVVSSCLSGTKLAKKNIEKFRSSSVKARLMHETEVTLLFMRHKPDYAFSFLLIYCECGYVLVV